MTYFNTADNYGRVAKWLHWTIALLFLLGYCAVYYRHWFTEKQTPENIIALQLHLSAGISVGALIVLRIIWRIMNIQPGLESAPRWQQLAAHWAHYALYIVMIVMPVTGYIGTGVATEYFYLFQIPKFESTRLFDVFVADYLGMTFKELEKPVDFFHKNIMGAWLVWILIAIHAVAALYHHFVSKDRTLRKMTNG